MLRSAVNKQISVSTVESRLLLAFLSVALVTGCLTATLPGPAATPTIAPAARRSIAEIRMIDAASGWAWSNGLGGQQLLCPSPFVDSANGITLDGCRKGQCFICSSGRQGQDGGDSHSSLV